VPKKDGFGRYEENFPGGDLTADEWEFVKAIDRYQRTFGRRYPSWREVLAVLRSLGYRRVAPAATLPRPPVGSPSVKPKSPTET
jgi:hypothetical protein